MQFLHIPCGGKGKLALSALEYKTEVTSVHLLLLSKSLITQLGSSSEIHHHHNFFPETTWVYWVCQVRRIQKRLALTETTQHLPTHASFRHRGSSSYSWRSWTTEFYGWNSFTISSRHVEERTLPTKKGIRVGRKSEWSKHFSHWEKNFLGPIMSLNWWQL